MHKVIHMKNHAEKPKNSYTQSYPHYPQSAIDKNRLLKTRKRKRLFCVVFPKRFCFIARGYML